jgi:hypothetical protein
MKLRNLSLVTVALLAYGAASARAGFVDTLTPNALNGYHDSSLEFVNFASSASSGLYVGDTIIGFQQINIKETPNALSTFNQIYTVFSETVTSITTGAGGVPGTHVTLGSTFSGNAFSLQNILAGSGLTIPAGTVGLLLDTQSNAGANFNALNIPPPGPPAATNMQQYIQQLAKNSASGLKYDGAFGFAAGDNSNLSMDLGTVGGRQIVANSTFVTNPATQVAFNAGTLNSTPESVRTLSSFTGGFSVLLNNIGVNFANDVIGNDLLPHQIVFSNGVAGGGATNPNYNVWGNPGFEDSADIFVHPTAGSRADLDHSARSRLRRDLGRLSPQAETECCRLILSEKLRSYDSGIFTVTCRDPCFISPSS